MADFTLTPGDDTFIGTADDDTVYATGFDRYANVESLNSGDSLTGGGGTDTLVLNGSNNSSGYFRVDDLGTFTGFEVIRVNRGGPKFGGRFFFGQQSVAVIGCG